MCHEPIAFSSKKTANTIKKGQTIWIDSSKKNTNAVTYMEKCPTSPGKYKPKA